MGFNERFGNWNAKRLERQSQGRRDREARKEYEQERYKQYLSKHKLAAQKRQEQRRDKQLEAKAEWAAKPRLEKARHYHKQAVSSYAGFQTTAGKVGKGIQRTRRTAADVSDFFNPNPQRRTTRRRTPQRRTTRRRTPRRRTTRRRRTPRRQAPNPADVWGW